MNEDCPTCGCSLDVEFLGEVKQLMRENPGDLWDYVHMHVFHCLGCYTTWRKVIKKHEMREI